MIFFKNLGKFFTSARLICALICYSVFFIFFASLKIRELGVSAVQTNFFEAWSCKIGDFPIYIFGGKFLGAMALTSLFFSLVKYWKFSLRGAAFALVHLGLMCLIASGFLQGNFREEGSLILSQNVPTSTVYVKNSNGEFKKAVALPFAVELVNFEKKQWENTDLPSEFLSRVKFLRGEESIEKVISMNKPASFGGFTFYQMGYREGGVSILQTVKNPFAFLSGASIFITFAGVVLVYVERIFRRKK